MSGRGQWSIVTLALMAIVLTDGCALYRPAITPKSVSYTELSPVPVRVNPGGAFDLWLDAASIDLPAGQGLRVFAVDGYVTSDSKKLVVNGGWLGVDLLDTKGKFMGVQWGLATQSGGDQPIPTDNGWSLANTGQPLFEFSPDTMVPPVPSFGWTGGKINKVRFGFAIQVQNPDTAAHYITSAAGWMLYQIL
jgi:hypothetical protein